jgi:glycine cleavage system H protein
MDGFSYLNIFETKGLEYLIIIAFLILLVPFSIMLNRKVKRRRQLNQAIGILTNGVLKIPRGVFISRNHTWVHLAKSGTAQIGLDDLLMHITGEVKVNYLKTAGEAVDKEEIITELMHDGKMLKVCSPISGKIAAVNTQLREEPWKLNEDPYGAGWMYRIEPANWKAETSSYLLADAAAGWSKNELLRFRDFLATRMPKYNPDVSMVALQDGGELLDHLLADMPEGMWREFEQEFMKH